MALIVKKFGGSSVATPEKMHNIVDRVLREKKPEDKIALVVSAMGDTTDDLISLAEKITDEMPKRELDMLLATGEQLSVALLASAFIKKGHPAKSFTGFQAGIKTTSGHSKARICSVDAKKVKKALDEGNIAVVAGFQGITEDGEITTLGRGGSDTTAVALASGLDADICEIFTDVEGIYTTDPRIVVNARKMREITFGEMLEMARLGAGVMQPRAVEYAEHTDMPIHVRSTFTDAEGTIIRREYILKEEGLVIRGVTDDKDVVRITVKGVSDKPGEAYAIFSALADANISVDMILQCVRADNQKVNDILFTIAKTDMAETVALMEKMKKEHGYQEIEMEANVAKVSIVGAGMLGNPGIAARMFGALAAGNINIAAISTSEISISCLISEDKVKEAVQAVHKEFFDEKCEC